jgi:hypothetical protein
VHLLDEELREARTEGIGEADVADDAVPEVRVGR